MNPETLRPIASAPAGDAEPGAATSATTGSLAQAKTSVTTAARETAARIKSAASETAGRAKETAQRYASDAKSGAADRIGGYSNAIHQSAKSLEQQDPNIAWATHRAADKLQQLADYVRDRDFDELKADAEDIARRHPVAFFGGMLIAGLVVGNLLKARSPVEETIDDETEDMLPDEPESSAAAAESPAATGI